MSLKTDTKNNFDLFSATFLPISIIKVLMFYIFNMNIFITEVCHQSDTEILTMEGTFLLVYEMYHQKIKKGQKKQNFCFC